MGEEPRRRVSGGSRNDLVRRESNGGGPSLSQPYHQLRPLSARSDCLSLPRTFLTSSSGPSTSSTARTTFVSPPLRNKGSTSTSHSWISRSKLQLGRRNRLRSSLSRRRHLQQQPRNDLVAGERQVASTSLILQSTVVAFDRSVFEQQRLLDRKLRLGLPCSSSREDELPEAGGGSCDWRRGGGRRVRLASSSFDASREGREDQHFQ